MDLFDCQCNIIRGVFRNLSKATPKKRCDISRAAPLDVLLLRTTLVSAALGISHIFCGQRINIHPSNARNHHKILLPFTVIYHVQNEEYRNTAQFRRIARSGISAQIKKNCVAGVNIFGFLHYRYHSISNSCNHRSL